MKKPFDFLFTDKEPFLYIEKSFLLVKDGCLVRVGSDGAVESVPVASIALLFLGPGTSVSHSAAKMCAEHDCYIGFVNGGVNVHSLWHAGRWPSPERALKQALIFSSHDLKLQAAKVILKHKLQRDGLNENIDLVLRSTSIEQLLGIEASLAKLTYRQLSLEHEQTFLIDKSSIEGVNGKISLLINMLYSYFSAAVTAFGLNPSMGFVHGTTRRGGLAFDIANIFKYELSLKPAFDEPEISNQKAMHKLATKLKANRSRITKSAYSILDEILELSCA